MAQFLVRSLTGLRPLAGHGSSSSVWRADRLPFGPYARGSNVKRAATAKLRRQWPPSGHPPDIIRTR